MVNTSRKIYGSKGWSLGMYNSLVTIDFGDVYQLNIRKLFSDAYKMQRIRCPRNGPHTEIDVPEMILVNKEKYAQETSHTQRKRMP